MRVYIESFGQRHELSQAKVKLKVWTFCYSAAYVSQTRDQKWQLIGMSGTAAHPQSALTDT